MYVSESIESVRKIVTSGNLLDSYKQGDTPIELKNSLFNVNREIKNILEYGGQFFIYRTNMSNQKDSKGFISRDFLDDNRMNSIIKLSCLFPGRVIIISDLYLTKMNDSTHDIKTFYTHCYDYIKKGMFYVWTEQLTNKKININQETKFLSKTDNENAVLNSIQLKIPWLYNARSCDYIEIVDKYDLAFLNFRKQIDKLSKVALSKEDLTRSFVSEYTDALIDMRIAIEKKENELKTKGIQTFFGFAFTAIPFLLPSHIVNIDPGILASIFGAVTLKGELIPLIKDAAELKALKKESVYSVLLRWERINNK